MILTPRVLRLVTPPLARAASTTARYNLLSSVKPVASTSAILRCRAAPVVHSFSTSCARRSSPHENETFEDFSKRYEKEFEQVNDVFELQRNLNNAFAYDLVPSPSVIEAALRAARRVNDFPTAVRVFEGLKAKVENTHQYQYYLDTLKPIREELGIVLREDMWPDPRPWQ